MTCPKITQKDWIEQSNQVFTGSSEVIHFQKQVKKNKTLFRLEQDWVDTYFQPLLDFFGSVDVWKTLVANVEIYGVDCKIVSNNKIPNSRFPQGHYSSTHWTCRLPTDQQWFDPYIEYQVFGTNQFCQTFALMYLCKKLPPRSNDRTWTKYYSYTDSALKFIKTTLRKHYPQETDLKKKVNECIKYSKRCVNCVELPSF